MDNGFYAPGGVSKIQSSKERTCYDEAIRLYRLVDSITAKGCDAEIKRVKGRFKVLTVRKSDSVFLD